MPAWLEKKIPLGQYISAGLLVFNLAAWRKYNLMQKAIELLLSRSLKKHDQDAINIICRGRIVYLSKIWNCLGDSEGKFSLDKCVFHYAGPIKPWHRFPPFKAEAMWWHYACETAIYPLLKQEAKQNKAGLNFEKKELYHRFCGIPLIRAKIRPRSVKYYFFKLGNFHFAELRQSAKGNCRILYICHIPICRCN